MSPDPVSAVGPCWAIDPWNPERYRWWDGERWTLDTHPVPGADAAAQARLSRERTQWVVSSGKALLSGSFEQAETWSKLRARRQRERADAAWFADMAAQAAYEPTAEAVIRLAEFRELHAVLPPGNPFWVGPTCDDEIWRAATCPQADLQFARETLRRAAWKEHAEWEASLRATDPQAWHAFLNWRQQQQIIDQQSAMLTMQRDSIRQRAVMVAQNAAMIIQNEGAARQRQRMVAQGNQLAANQRRIDGHLANLDRDSARERLRHGASDTPTIVRAYK
jgi:hypothetical protein